MATMITSECINCGACEPECPNTAIYQGGVEWELDGTQHAAIANDIFYIVPEKCTECVGFFDHEACAAVCPVDCCIPNPQIPETEEQLIVRAKQLHPESEFGSDFPSRFRKDGAQPATAAAAAPAGPASTPAPQPVAAPAAVAPVAEVGPSASLPDLDDWEVPVDCHRCQGSYAVAFKHFRSGVVLYCPFCNGSYVVTTSIYGRVAGALLGFHRGWTEQFDSFQERRRRELDEFEERQRAALETLNNDLRRFSAEARPPGAPKRRAGIFG